MIKQYWLRANRDIEQGDFVQCTWAYGPFVHGEIHCVLRIARHEDGVPVEFYIVGHPDPCPVAFWSVVTAIYVGNQAVVWNNIGIKPFELGDIVTIERIYSDGVAFSRESDHLSILTNTPELYLEAYEESGTTDTEGRRRPQLREVSEFNRDRVLRTEIADMIVELLERDHLALLTQKASDGSIHVFTDKTYSTYSGGDMLSQIFLVLSKATNRHIPEWFNEERYV